MNPVIKNDAEVKQLLEKLSKVEPPLPLYQPGNFLHENSGHSASSHHVNQSVT
jgi:hypothetical protein